MVTRFRVGVGHCAGCRRRVQGRHPEQTSDALGAAAAQLDPHARALGHWLHYVLGLSFGKTSTLLGRLGVPVTAGALSSGAQSTGLALVPTTTAIRKAVASSAVVVMDETGWRIAATHQTCTAHLLRRCVEMIEADHPQGQATPRQVKTLLTEALAARELPEAERAVEAERIGAGFDALIARPQHCDPDRRLVKHLANERTPSSASSPTGRLTPPTGGLSRQSAQP